MMPAMRVEPPVREKSRFEAEDEDDFDEDDKSGVCADDGRGEHLLTDPSVLCVRSHRCPPKHADNARQEVLS